MQTVSRSQVVTAEEAVEEALPPRIQEALGQLVGAAKEGLLALSVGVGLGVLEELMAEEVEDVCGPKGKHDPDRTVYRHGSDDGEVTLGGRRVPVQRPRMRSKDGEEEVPVGTYEQFTSRDQLSRVVLERMLAGSRRAATGVCRSRSVSRSNSRRGRRRSRRCPGRSSRARRRRCWS
jgi:putative transposase